MKKSRRRSKRPPNRWQASAEWRAIGSAAARSWNAKRHLRPKCGARRKYDGKPCQQLAMANGRCVYHGGRTPRGDNWHRTVWPNPGAPNAEKKLQDKLRSQQRAAAKRAARLAAMTPEEREDYERRRRFNQPSSAAERERRRQAKREAVAAREMLKAPRIEPENAEIEALRRRREQLERKRAEITEIEDPGVFG